MPNQITQGFRLSPQQKHLWSLQQHSLAYFAQCAILLKGNLKPEALKAALEQVVVRHGILRTTFQHLPGMKIPVMVLGNTKILSWRDIYLSHCEPKKLSSKIEYFFQEARGFSLDFEQGALLHVSLLTLSVNKYILLISLPSLCADTWTLKNLVTEISNSYSACLQENAVSEEVVQYLQFSEWQNQLLEDEDAQTAKQYWDEQKISTLASLKLPFENKLLQLSKFEVDCYRLNIIPNITAKITTLAQKYNTSVAVVLLACWQTLIWRLTRQADIVIGMASDRRDYEELHNLLGLVASWLPIKSYFTPDLCFKEVVELANQTIEASAEWQDYFVPEPIENEQLTFPIGFEFEQLPEELVAGDVSFSLEQYYSCIEQFKIKLTCTQRQHSLTTEFYYDINYFSADTIERIGRQFQTLLTSVTANPEEKISQVEILSPSDRQQLLVEFNQTHLDNLQDKCTHQLFEAQVQKTPNKIAVVFENQQLTYAQLNSKANQLANYLQQQAVKPEVLVGLCVERSLLMIIGLLGILKAGGAYLPLDPTLPKDGFASRLQNTEIPVILTQQRLVNALPTHTAQIVCLDTDWDTIAQHKDENPISEVTTENLAYVLFTSGSTGKPKGVAIEHQQLLNYLNGITQRLDLSATTNFATVSTLAADLGNTSIFAALCTGGCLHVLSAECATDSAALAKYCRTHPIDCLKIVPSHLATLLAAAPSDSILPRQQLILGGEAANWQLIEQIQQQAPSSLIFNHYGPTEATVGVTTFAVDRQINHGQTVPLGRPLANTQIYLLDEQLQPVPIGLPGELYIGGAGLARGYLNQPDLTAAQFIPNPFEEAGGKAAPVLAVPVDGGLPNPKGRRQVAGGSRLYKTGDLARYLPDGNIEFIGRVDHQVKIRGFRIELGEIESVLCQHLQVQQAVVSVQEDNDNKFLIAYIVPKQTLSVSELQRFLREKLPEYMMPATFIMLKALPLTPNGKVNRRELPESNGDRPELAATYEPPQTEVEQAIANIWQQMLHVEKVGIYDNFFDLGGHSLLLVQIHAKLREILHTDISVINLFEYPTINSLAKYLTQEPTETSSFEESTQRAESRTASRQSRAQYR
ncbi:amino acid adenylation domain-containing protein [Nostoc sp. ChiQUE01b]|uniref:non-ribosomal peptide synthetase n=1 Tax=Nostoc sp. ChiQUE01b TaxID=3075376 RepID=UPI002AD59376|nr:amino acid adenylation domain-containing protein [Nostoc sp. ChiQUE01b]MDZ8257280.1 amino acid adenylation domain-containing protein [Nostoc sp. ChiQUE01b]